MPQLLKNVESSDDLFLKHGSILAIGELSLGLSNEASKSRETLTKYFGENVIGCLALLHLFRSVLSSSIHAFKELQAA
jgi:hypothetical protein